MKTLVGNDENLTKEDCLEWLYSTETFFELRHIHRHRIGQAWFNCLTKEDQDKLRGSFFDPFHRDDWPSVIRALRFLLEN